MLEKNIQASPKEKLSSNSTPTEIANFCRGINLSQFRRAVEYYDGYYWGRTRNIVPLMQVLKKAASLSP